MNVGNIHGAGGLGHGQERPEGRRRAEARDVSAGLSAADVADISARAQENLEALEDLAKRVQDRAEERRDLVDDARSRLESGQLDRSEVYEATAERMLLEGF